MSTRRSSSGAITVTMKPPDLLVRRLVTMFQTPELDHNGAMHELVSRLVHLND